MCGAFCHEHSDRGLRVSTGYTILKDGLQPLRKQAKSVVVQRFETPPGAQMDWGHSGSLSEAGWERKLWGLHNEVGPQPPDQ
jgi:hypothetical protein